MAVATGHKITQQYKTSQDTTGQHKTIHQKNIPKTTATSKAVNEQQKKKG